MNNNFDILAKVALNEASLGDYMKAARSMAAKAGKSVAKGAVKGLAQLPGAAIKGAGKAIQGAGAVYGALGGTQGAALANSVGGAVAGVGGAVQKAGLGAVTGAAKLWKDLKTIAEKQEYIRKNLPGVKNYITKNNPTLTNKQKDQLGKLTDFEQLEKFTKENIRGRSFDQIMTGYNREEVSKAEAEAKKQTANTQASTTQPTAPQNQTTGTNAKTPEGNPVAGQTRFTTADKKKTYLYGKDGWRQYDPNPKKWSAPVQQQAQVTAAWQKSQNITPATKPAASAGAPSAKATKNATQTKGGVPVAQPTAADIASMNLPPHPVTSRTPPNRPS